MCFIYIIQLEKGKYYIGKTNNPQLRLESHFNSNGSEWTKLYKPLRVIEVKPNCDDYDEDKITIQYMDKYGINNVRGGSFVSVKLEKSVCWQTDTDEELWICEYCGKEFTEQQKCKYHEKKCDKNNTKCNCPSSYFSPHRKIKCFLNNELLCESDTDDDNNDDCCFRCGREGHYASSCYASKHIKGYYLQ